MRTLCFIYIVLMAACTGCKQPNPQQNFCFNPLPDCAYKLSVKGKTEEHWMFHEKPQYSTDSFETNYIFQLLQKTDTTILLKLQFDNFMKEGGSTVKINTNDRAASLEAANNKPELLYDYLLHFAKGRYVTVWMDEKGRPLQVNGIASVIDSIAKLSGVSKSITRIYLEDFISDAVIKDEIKKLFCFLPGKPKSVGQSWVENIMLLAKAPIKWSTDFKMRYKAGDTVAIECNSFVTARLGDEAGRTYMKGKLLGNIVAGYGSGIPYQWNAKIETITNTDDYEILSTQVLMKTITPIKP